MRIFASSWRSPHQPGRRLSAPRRERGSRATGEPTNLASPALRRRHPHRRGVRRVLDTRCPDQGSRQGSVWWMPSRRGEARRRRGEARSGVRRGSLHTGAVCGLVRRVARCRLATRRRPAKIRLARPTSTSRTCSPSQDPSGRQPNVTAASASPADRRILPVSGRVSPLADGFNHWPPVCWSRSASRRTRVDLGAWTQRRLGLRSAAKNYQSCQLASSTVQLVIADECFYTACYPRSGSGISGRRKKARLESALPTPGRRSARTIRHPPAGGRAPAGDVIVLNYIRSAVMWL
ncbi:hypothetical protein J2S43_007013 [Catenuloplanes nepalensis]|uniref:Uncharacterized protein n=1 Tax=Catenuloplanes nepalensis TaxID=587533 RepID=A0ABT9N5I2_9ACTN|nr:hypothetical protein [Catenuloplanes nepalensis]